MVHLHLKKYRLFVQPLQLAPFPIPCLPCFFLSRLTVTAPLSSSYQSITTLKGHFSTSFVNRLVWDWEKHGSSLLRWRPEGWKKISSYDESHVLKTIFLGMASWGFCNSMPQEKKGKHSSLLQGQGQTIFALHWGHKILFTHLQFFLFIYFSEKVQRQ